MTEIEQEKSRQSITADNNRMFAEIADRYDWLNHLLSLNFDKKWRKELVTCAQIKPGEKILDVCTGTGEVAIRFAETEYAGDFTGIDSSEEMLKIAEEKIKKKGLGEKIKLKREDSLALPFDDHSFDIVSMAFGLRNIVDYKKGISEMARVLKDGGRLVMLEFSPPLGTFFGRIYRFYLNKLLPTIGGMLSGSREAYLFLSDSICSFPEPKEIVQVMQKEDLKNVCCRALTGGTVYLYRGEKQTPKQEQKEVLTQAEKQTFSQNIIQGDLFKNL